MSEHYINDDLITYNLRYITEHYDSSEFGDHGDDTPNGSFLIRPEVFKKYVAEKDVPNKVNSQDVGQNVTTSVTSITIPCHHCGRLVKNCTLALKAPEENCSPATPKENVNKLSDISQRFNNRKTGCTEENDSNAINTTLVYCADCRQRQIRKFYRKQQRYRPVDTNETKALLPLAPNNQTSLDEPTKNPFSNTNIVCTHEVNPRKKKVYKYKTNDFVRDLEIKQVNPKNKSHLKNRSQQCSKYAVYNSQCCQARDNEATASGCCRMPSVPSFWEFMFNQLSAKYQEAWNLAACENCKSINVNTLRHPKMKPTTSQATNETQTEDLSPDTESQRFNSQLKVESATSNKNGECQTTDPKLGKRTSSILDMFHLRSSQQPSPTPSKKPNAPLNSKPLCSGKCSGKCSKTMTHDKPVTKLTFPNNDKACQLSHEGLTKALKEKYNGEVLCIHNPQCILINGCVNLPHQTPKPLDIWQITTARRKADPKKNHRLEICQLPSVELTSGREDQSDKKGRICNDISQCEVVPVCYKSACSPEFSGSCDHEPSCKKLPVCMIETEQKDTRFSCEHMPLSGMPDSFELSELGSGKDQSLASDGSAQVEQPLCLVCHHNPHCLMIPKCLGRVMVIRRKGGAIPDCIHRPPCEYIPACGRNYVKMLAACSCSLGSRPQCRIT